MSFKGERGCMSICVSKQNMSICVSKQNNKMKKALFPAASFTGNQKPHLHADQVLLSTLSGAFICSRNRLALCFSLYTGECIDNCYKLCEALREFQR